MKTPTLLLFASLLAHTLHASVFIATPVYLKNGTYEAQEVIKGCVMYSQTDDGVLTLATVVKTFRTAAAKGFVLHLPRSPLSISADQLVWDATRQQWIKADEIDNETRLLTPRGDLVAVRRVTPFYGNEYHLFCDLSLSGPHSFFAGDDQVLVHNHDESFDANEIPVISIK